MLWVDFQIFGSCLQREGGASSDWNEIPSGIFAPRAPYGPNELTDTCNIRLYDKP